MNKILIALVLIICSTSLSFAYERYDYRNGPKGSYKKEESKSDESIRNNSFYDSNNKRCRVRDHGNGKKIYGPDGRVYKERVNGSFYDEHGNRYLPKTSGYKTKLEGNPSSKSYPGGGFKNSPADRFFRWTGRGIKAGFNKTKGVFK